MERNIPLFPPAWHASYHQPKGEKQKENPLQETKRWYERQLRIDPEFRARHNALVAMFAHS